jgi:hypothetical protein
MCQHGLGSILNSAKAKCRAVAGINACDKYLAKPLRALNYGNGSAEAISIWFKIGLFQFRKVAHACGSEQKLREIRFRFLNPLK